MGIKNAVESVRKKMVLFMLSDVSTSMRKGGKIDVLNKAMRELVPILRKLSDENDDAEILLANLIFSSGVYWKDSDDAPISLDDYMWTDVEAGGMTELGAAFLALDEKLSRKAFLKSQTGCFAPVIILLSDGEPNDDWQRALKTLQNNNWYKQAIKIAINIGSDTPMQALYEFTGSKESVLKANDKDTLKNLIHKVAIMSSEFVTHSVNTDNDKDDPVKDAENIVKDIKEEENEYVDEDVDEDDKDLNDESSWKDF